MSVDATAYRPPASRRAPGRDLAVDGHECLRVGVTVATVWLFPWAERSGTTYAVIDRADEFEPAHLAPATVDALLAIAPIVEAVPLLNSPAWPVIDGPVP